MSAKPTPELVPGAHNVLAALEGQPFAISPPSCDVCGIVGVERWGDLCAKCSTDRERHRRRVLLSRARDEIPELYRWAHFEAKELRQRVRVPSFVPFIEIVGAPRTISIWGPAQHGKTSLACAMLRTLLRVAEKPEAPDTVLARAAGARFVKVAMLPGPRKYGGAGALNEEVADAIDAPLIVLDGLGEEQPDSPQVASASLIILERHDRERISWVTVALQDGAAFTSFGRYDGAVLERIARDEPGRQRKFTVGGSR